MRIPKLQIVGLAEPLAIVAWLACSAMPRLGAAATIYVAPNGSDAADGRAATVGGSSGPVASIAAALERMRAQRANNAATGTERIVIAPGQYQLTEPMRIGTADNRNGDVPLVIEAERPGTVLLSGGRAIGPFQARNDRWEAQAGGPQFDILWVDDRRAVRARSPNGGKFFTGARNVMPPVREPRPYGATLPNNIENTKRLVLPEAAQAVMRSVLDGNGRVPPALNLYAMHSWTSSAHEIKAYDAATGIATVGPSSRWPFLTWGADQRFALDNHPVLLDEPGEWLSADGRLQYIPLSGQQPTAVRFVAPKLDRLMEIAGTANEPVRNVTLRGLRFAYSGAKLSPFIDSQAATAVPSAVIVDYAQNIQVDDCAFEHIGGYALWLRKGVVGSAVRRSLFDDLGAGGIRVGQEQPSQASADQTSSNRIENNLVRNGGRSFPGGIGIWVGQSGSNTIANNELHGLNYTAISVGWTWGYGPSDARKNIIKSNYIHDIGQGTLSDMGGIYTLGRTEGTMITGNRIEDVTSYSQSGATAWAIYLDAGSSDIVVEDNVALRTTGGGFHLHYGHDIKVTNNVFAYSQLAQARRTGRGADATLEFNRNVLVGKGSVYAGQWQESEVPLGTNVTADETTGGPADPRLKCTAGDCKISADVAKTSGFTQFSTAEAGITSRGYFLGK
jgi:hypothetical protein